MRRQRESKQLAFLKVADVSSARKQSLHTLVFLPTGGHNDNHGNGNFSNSGTEGTARQTHRHRQGRLASHRPSLRRRRAVHPSALHGLDVLHTGMHQITSKGNDFYRGRLWPGAAPARDSASSPNAAAFNHFFSVFIDEMLHLQLASNIAKALGVMPSYTSPALVNADYGW